MARLHVGTKRILETAGSLKRYHSTTRKSLADAIRADRKALGGSSANVRNRYKYHGKGIQRVKGSTYGYQHASPDNMSGRFKWPHTKK